MTQFGQEDYSHDSLGIAGIFCKPNKDLMEIHVIIFDYTIHRLSTHLV